MTLRPDAKTVERLDRIKLVLMDVDGTLVTSDQLTFSRVVHQLRGLRSLGVRSSIATGRTLQGVAPILQQMADVGGGNLPPMITYNGAVVALQEKPLVLNIKTIERAAFHELIRRCRLVGVSPLAYACTATLFGLEEIAFTERSDGPATEFNGSVVRRVNDLLQLDDDIVAVLIERPGGEVGDALLAELSATFAGILRVTTSGGPYIEICHRDGTKRNAMFELARMLEIDLSEVMAIGDNYNDLEMIEAAGVGVAVANAPEPVKAVAALSCSQAGARGVVEVLRVLTRVLRTERRLIQALSTRSTSFRSNL